MGYVGVLIVGISLAGTLGLSLVPAVESAEKATASSTKTDSVIAMAEQFGLIVGPVTEDIRKELNLRSAEGVAVFEVIGDSLADEAGIKVGAVIAEINKAPVRNLEDFGRLLPEALAKGNFTVGTWEPTNPENQGIAQQMNFHFVPKRLD
jgi:S1-C subfamily serine protease